MNLTQLREKRTALLAEATALRGADGTFADDAARTAFDAKMAEVEALDTQIRSLAAAPPAPATPPAVEPRLALAVTPPPANAEATTAERQRAADIRTAVRAARLEESVADDLVAGGQSIDQARAVILERLTASDATRPTEQHVTVGEDARDKWLRGASAWLLQRTGMASVVAKHEGIEVRTLDPGEFRGLSLLDLAKESLVRSGQKVRGLDKLAVAGQAMAYRANYQTTSDFAVLLENTMHKVLRATYAMTPDTWSRWCGIADTMDFRTHNWYRTGWLSVLDAKLESGEFKNKTIPDAEKATYSVTTKGNIVGLTRETVVNDDLGGVMRTMQALGRAGKLTIEVDVYALLALNSGLGPTQSDSQPLFHSNRANVGSSATIAMAALDADRVIMASQTGPNANEILDLRPDVLLVPIGLGGTARSINEALYDPDTANKLQKPNTVRGLFSDIVDTARLTGNRRYLFADPAVAPVFIVSFLEGQREPVLETQDGWRYDGVEMKARLDFGVDAVDFRGAVTNAGG